MFDPVDSGAEATTTSRHLSTFHLEAMPDFFRSTPPNWPCRTG